MEEEILKKMEEQDKKLQEIHRSVEKMRKYFLWTIIISVVFIVLPLIALVFIIPQFLNSFDLNSLGI
jgi:type II secretory pathway component PulF